MFKNNKYFYLILLILAVLDLFIWIEILFREAKNNLELYFFDVGQGDSEMIAANGIKILIDGGPANSRILEELSKILPSADRYLDLVIMSHPQLDHYGGLIDVLKNYRIGAFISNGRKGESAAYQDLIKTIKDNLVPYIVLAEGDKIRHQKTLINVLGPSVKNLNSYELNNTSLVLFLENSGLKALYAGDIGAEAEKELSSKYDLSAQILKIGHHGSKYSSNLEFLKAISPKISIIEVGKNSYGHPATEILNRLSDIQSMILRTDIDKSIQLIFNNENLEVYK